jgi:hypothetical protein
MFIIIPLLTIFLACIAARLIYMNDDSEDTPSDTPPNNKWDDDYINTE